MNKLKKLITSTKFFFALCVLVFLLALGLRLGPSTALYWEEVALGYDAYSISTTLRDHHGNFLPTVSFVSFGDYKPSGYFYALAPLIAIFGPHDFIVRLPSLLAGLAIICLCARLIYILSRNKWLALLTAFLVAINPAFIQLSRAAWETNLATAFLLGGIVLWLKAIYLKKNWSLVFGTLCLLLSFYTYHSMRFVAPLLGLYLFIWWFIKHKVWQSKQTWPQIGALLALIVLFLTPFLFANQLSNLTHRLNDTSIFMDISLIEASNACHASASKTIIGYLSCHRFVFYGQKIISHALAHFDPQYLFISGEGNRRHSIGMFGVFYPLDALFMLGGIFFCATKIKKHKVLSGFFLFWLLVGLFPATISYPSPHLLRSLNTVPLLIFLVIAGFSWWQQRLRKYFKIFLSCCLVFYALFVWAHQIYYYTTYLVDANYPWWQADYPYALNNIRLAREQYPDLPIYFTRSLGRPAMYYFWYNRIDPRQVQLVEKPTSANIFDQAEFTAFPPDNIYFTNELPPANAILVSFQEDSHWLETTIYHVD